MPLLTASTPVIAVQPLANARNSNHHVTASVPGEGGGGATTGAGSPVAAIVSAIPNSNSPPKLATNR